MVNYRLISLLIGAVASANPLILRQDSTTSTPTPTIPVDTCTTSSTTAQWLSICNTTVFWPTSTDYYYGPTTGAEASAVSCNAEWIQHDGRASELQSLGSLSTTTYETSYAASSGLCYTDTFTESWNDAYSGPATTLCDGIPRALQPLQTSTSYWPDTTGPCVTFFGTDTMTTEVYRSPSPTPDCSLSTEDCIPIWSTYSSLHSDYTGSTPGDTNSPIAPEHCPSTARNYTEQDPCTNCHYLPGTATLFYWPVTTINGDLCLQNGSTIPATPTDPSGPNTALIDGRTFTSPSIYVSFTSIYARSNQRAHPGGSCGGEYEDVLISALPEAISSYRGHLNAKYPVIGTAYPFGYAEFQPHVLGNYTMPLIPWDKYSGGAQCPARGSVCTMVRDDYMPYMGIPEGVMTQIDPRWTECDREWYIPPVSMVALGGNELEAKPTGEAMGGDGGLQQAVPEGGLAVPTPEATGW
ncbi:hypothetical protein FE257_007919 [Aspergillus nanangensis]|uniref:Uncharacterized protein n=1 Tax=Aspergillus nanangensis TaxID=2582783 RepID=A0AAD4GYY7_ASPNN|nr:hypothetical protein FE257_007919 [Aspergillus nanangensis]